MSEKNEKQGEEHKRSAPRYKMTDKTRRLIGRLKDLIKETGTTIRKANSLAKLPEALRPEATLPIEYKVNQIVDWSRRATILCMTRASLRGKMHMKSMTMEQQAAFITDTLARYEAVRSDAFPTWFTATIRAALTAGVEDKARRAKFQTRFESFESKQKEAVAA